MNLRGPTHSLLKLVIVVPLNYVEVLLSVSMLKTSTMKSHSLTKPFTPLMCALVLLPMEWNWCSQLLLTKTLETMQN